MRVFKFGGASIATVEGFKNVGEIIKTHLPEGRLIVVVSAIGKTTNRLEKVVDAFCNRKDNAVKLWSEVYLDHLAIAKELLGDPVLVEKALSPWNDAMQLKLGSGVIVDYAFEYDQIVSMGELMSSSILSKYLVQAGLPIVWKDARSLIKTNDTFQEGKVDWTETERLVRTACLNRSMQSYLSQGFIGGTIKGDCSTLGREGSDYSAAIFAACVDAKSVTIWKDVPGVLNGDPRVIQDTVLIKELSYYEAIEMTYYGAKVIHSKTLKPLQNKQIPLYVRSFLDQKNPGTNIQGDEAALGNDTAVIVVKKDQFLISLITLDHSFIAEDNLSKIYDILAEHQIKVNMSQNAAMSFSFVVDSAAEQPKAARGLLIKLRQYFKVITNDHLKLVTIRNYNDKVIAAQIANATVLLEQRSRHTVQFLLQLSE